MEQQFLILEIFSVDLMVPESLLSQMNEVAQFLNYLQDNNLFHSDYEAPQGCASLGYFMYRGLFRIA